MSKNEEYLQIFLTMHGAKNDFQRKYYIISSFSLTAKTGGFLHASSCHPT